MNNHARWFLLACVVIVVIGAIVYLEQQKAGDGSDEISQGQALSNSSINTNSDAEQQPQQLSEEDKRRIEAKAILFKKAPDFVGVVGAINAEKNLSLNNLKGKIVMVDFWTYSCINCIRTLPYLVAWDKKYRDQGLVIVGVHTPEFAFEEDIENVQDAVERNSIEYPVILDNNKRTWNAYQNRFWPRKYIVDADGFIRYDHIGEGGYEETEQKVQELLSELGVSSKGMATDTIVGETANRLLTPELYAGYDYALPRGQRLGNIENFVEEEKHNYTLPPIVGENTIHLQGLWTASSEYLQSDSGTLLRLIFTAQRLHMVSASRQPDHAEKIRVLIDGLSITQEAAGEDIIFEDGQSYLLVDEPRLYTIYRGTYGKHTVDLIATDGFRINAFTFG